MDLFTVTSRLLIGFGENCIIFLLTLLFALPLGLVIAFGSMSKFKPLAWLTKIFVWIIRGSPLMLQVIIVYYGPGLMWGWKAMGRTEAVIIAFIINYAAYFSEIYRGGIEGIPKGQYEAAQVLGMTKSQIFFKVILMQVIKRILAPMSNEVITLVKDTSLAKAIAVAEIFHRNEMAFLARGLVWPLFYIGAFFLLFVGVLTLLFGYREKKLSYYKI